MGKNMNELLLAELKNLGGGPETRRAATEFLKSNIKQLDSKYLQIFLSHAYEINDLGSLSAECILFLLEVLTQTHGRNMIPHISETMKIITKILSSSPDSFTIHQSSSKVGPTMLRYGIDPLMSKTEKARIVRSICKPLSDLLMGSHENVASGSAVCLQALAESENWKFASHSLVSEVCRKVSSALEESRIQTANHMGLVVALSQTNPRIVNTCYRQLLISGIQILTCEANDNLNSQRRLDAIKMIDILMICVDSRNISFAIDKVVDVMEKLQNDGSPSVSGAAFEAWQTAKIVKQRHEIFCSRSRLNSNSNPSKRSNECEGSPLSIGQASSRCESMHNSPQSFRHEFDDGDDGDGDNIKDDEPIMLELKIKGYNIQG